MVVKSGVCLPDLSIRYMILFILCLSVFFTLCYVELLCNLSFAFACYSGYAHIAIVFIYMITKMYKL